MALYGDGLDSLRLFLEAMAKAGKLDWLGNPEPYTRDLPASHPDKVRKPEDLIDIWRRSLEQPGIGQIPPSDKPSV
jgi:hypothetical protein